MTVLTASDIAARRIREARNRRGWTVKQLAEHCVKAGAGHLTAAVITNLETRRRPGREITADELLALAWVLGVPPLQLLAPLSDDETLQVVPGRDLAPLDAAGWLTDDDSALAPVWKIRSTSGEEPVLRPGSSPLTVLRQIRSVTRAIRNHDRALTDEKYRRFTGGTDTEHENSVTMLAWRLLRLLGALEMFGYPRMAPEEMKILDAHGLPADPADWDLAAPGAEGDSDGESA